MSKYQIRLFRVDLIAIVKSVRNRLEPWEPFRITRQICRRSNLAVRWIRYHRFNRIRIRTFQWQRWQTRSTLADKIWPYNNLAKFIRTREFRLRKWRILVSILRRVGGRESKIMCFRGRIVIIHSQLFSRAANSATPRNRAFWSCLQVRWKSLRSTRDPKSKSNSIPH